MAIVGWMSVLIRGVWAGGGRGHARGAVVSLRSGWNEARQASCTTAWQSTARTSTSNKTLEDVRAPQLVTVNSDRQGDLQPKRLRPSDPC